MKRAATRQSVAAARLLASSLRPPHIALIDDDNHNKPRSHSRRCLRFCCSCTGTVAVADLGKETSPTLASGYFFVNESGAAQSRSQIGHRDRERAGTADTRDTRRAASARRTNTRPRSAAPGLSPAEMSSPYFLMAFSYLR